MYQTMYADHHVKDKTNM